MVFLVLLLSTCLSGIFLFSMLRSIFQLKENREHRDSNPGLLGEKRERYLCAMPPPEVEHVVFSKLLIFVNNKNATNWLIGDLRCHP